MKIPIFLLALLSVAASTTQAQTKAVCQVEGKIKGLGDQPVVVFYDWQGQQHRDTVRARHDRFSYTAHPSDDGRFNLKIIPSRFTPIWFELGQITVAGSVAEPTKLTVTGTPENALTTQYNQQIEWKFEQRAIVHSDSLVALGQLLGTATRQFIAAHPQAHTSAALLYEQAKYRNDQPVDVYERLLNSLSPAVRASAHGRQVAQRLAVLRKRPQVGRPLLAFTIPNTANRPVALAQFRGQYVLLDFWGHWCRPCIQSMPHLKQVQTSYAGQLAVVGIGMEAAADRPLWLRAIRTHHLTWTQLSELKSDKGVIEQLNVEQFPTYMLLDRKGNLLVMSSDLAVVEARLQSLLGGR